MTPWDISMRNVTLRQMKVFVSVARHLSFTRAARELHLTGIVSEHGFQGQSHWLMFLFEVKTKILNLPAPHREGRFQFFSREQLNQLNVPQTDVEQIWPWFWQHRGGFFAAHCRCDPDGGNEWTLEESLTLDGTDH